MEICKADYVDLKEILQLQYLSYQIEAALFDTKDIPPLKQTLDEVIEEFNSGIVLNMISEKNDIIGSIRAKEKDGTVYVGKLMVHPEYRCRGYGTRLLTEIEKYFSGRRYELFTSTKSVDNIVLYQINGYRIFQEKAVDDNLIFVYMEKLL